MPRRKKLRVNPDLVTLSRGHRMPRRVQAELSGFTHFSNFSTVLYAPALEVSPRLDERMKVLAALLGFIGPVFVETDERAEAGQ